MNSHVRMDPVPLRFPLQAELIGRGGGRWAGKLIPPHDIDAEIRQRRGQNKVEEETKRVSGEGSGADYDLQCSRQCDASATSKGNPATPDPPWAFLEVSILRSLSLARGNGITPLILGRAKRGQMDIMLSGMHVVTQSMMGRESGIVPWKDRFIHASQNSC